MQGYSWSGHPLSGAYFEVFSNVIMKFISAWCYQFFFCCFFCGLACLLTLSSLGYCFLVKECTLLDLLTGKYAVNVSVFSYDYITTF